MTKIHAALLFGFTLALAACDDSATRPSDTAPNVGPAFDEVGADATPRPVAGGDAILLTDEVGTEQAATGGRASGHYEIDVFGFVTEQSSFSGLSTDPFPTAKGELEWHATNIFGPTTFELHADVDCLSIVGNQAWLSGPAERFVVNGVPQAVGFHVQWRVEDNGEGASSPPDRGSQLFFSQPQGCRFRTPFTLFPSERGNIQVRQK